MTLSRVFHNENCNGSSAVDPVSVGLSFDLDDRDRNVILSIDPLQVKVSCGYRRYWLEYSTWLYSRTDLLVIDSMLRKVVPSLLPGMMDG